MRAEDSDTSFPRSSPVKRRGARRGSNGEDGMLGDGRKDFIGRKVSGGDYARAIASVAANDRQPVVVDAKLRKPALKWGQRRHRRVDQCTPAAACIRSVPEY